MPSHRHSLGVYTPGEEEQTGEKLVREALDSWKGPREEVTVATKVGLRRAWEGDKPFGRVTASRSI